MAHPNDRKPASHTRIPAAPRASADLEERVHSRAFAERVRAIRRLNSGLSDAGLKAERKDITAFASAVDSLELVLLADADDATKATIMSLASDYILGLVSVAEGRPWPRWTNVESSLRETERALRVRTTQEIARMVSAVERGDVAPVDFEQAAG